MSFCNPVQSRKRAVNHDAATHHILNSLPVVQELQTENAKLRKKLRRFRSSLDYLELRNAKLEAEVVQLSTKESKSQSKDKKKDKHKGKASDKSSHKSSHKSSRIWRDEPLREPDWGAPSSIPPAPSPLMSSASVSSSDFEMFSSLRHEFDAESASDPSSTTLPPTIMEEDDYFFVEALHQPPKPDDTLAEPSDINLPSEVEAEPEGGMGVVQEDAEVVSGEDDEGVVQEYEIEAEVEAEEASIEGDEGVVQEYEVEAEAEGEEGVVQEYEVEAEAEVEAEVEAEEGGVVQEYEVEAEVEAEEAPIEGDEGVVQEYEAEAEAEEEGVVQEYEVEAEAEVEGGEGVVQEYEVDAEAEAEVETEEGGVYEVVLRGKSYWVENEQDGPIYEVEEGTEDFKEVGIYRKGKPVFFQ